MSFWRNVPLLAGCHALYMSGTSLLVATSALVGHALAADKRLASAAFTVQLLATMLASIPAAGLMASIGRKPAFMVGTVIAVAGAVTCTLAILQGQFWLFIVGSMLLGIFSGFANFYRFAAADNVDDALKSRAISYVLAGGVIAAFIGPNLANLTRDSLGNTAFAGSYAAIVVLYVLSFILLSLLKLPQIQVFSDLDTPSSGRPLQTIASQPRYLIALLTGMFGYATMTLIMTATPLAMEVCSYGFDTTSLVIQWHVLAMFAPSFFTGQLIERFGLLRIMLLGAVFGLACVVINLNGTTVEHFWVALFLLGLSWNFLFIGSTTLLTETYRPEERFKAQALNDFSVFSVVAAASLSAGVLHHISGWMVVNYAAIPLLFIILLALGWLRSEQRDKQTGQGAVEADRPDGAL